MSALARLFLAAEAEAPEVTAHEGARPLDGVSRGPRIGVVGPGRRAIGAGCAVAHALAGRRGGAALVCVWGGPLTPISWRSAPSRAARALADRVRAGAPDALAAGRLVVVTVTGVDDVVAADDAAGSLARVLVVAGPRDAAVEPVLTDADAVGVVRAPGALAAVDTLALAGLPAGSVAIDGAAGPAAALALCGIAVVPSLARGVNALVETVG